MMEVVMTLMVQGFTLMPPVTDGFATAPAIQCAPASTPSMTSPTNHASALIGEASSAVLLGGESALVQILCTWSILAVALLSTDLEMRVQVFGRPAKAATFGFDVMEAEKRAKRAAELEAVQDSVWKGSWQELAATCGVEGCAIDYSLPAAQCFQTERGHWICV
jgi:hypothetical protein